MPLSMTKVIVVVLWLAICRALINTRPILARVPDNRNPRVNTFGLFPWGPASEEEAELDSNGADHINKVFTHRFSHVLRNSTERSYLYAALDLILAAEKQLQTDFIAATGQPPLLHYKANYSPAAQHVLQLARTLSAMVASGIADLQASNVMDALRQTAGQLANLSPASCHPYTRRAVLASLVQLQLRLHESELATGVRELRENPETSALIFSIYRRLFNIHRQGAAAKGAIEFLHVSKSGGTSMCSIADRNGCSAESTTNYGNCMVRRFDDRPRWVSAVVHNQSTALDGWRWFYRYAVQRGERSCEYRDEFLQRMRFNFYSNEFALHGGLEGPATATGNDPWKSAHLCSQFFNVVMLRQPLARLLSHIKWIIRVYRAEYGRRSEAFFRARDADYWRTFAPAAVDNYYIRLLLGEAVFYLPTGAINTSHLDAAKLILLQYDVVLLLEADDIDELWLRMALGWRVGLSSAQARVSTNHRATNELVPFDVDELMAANADDVQLYSFGAVLHQLDGLMFAAVAAAGIQPYVPFADYNASDERVGHRVRCGYVTRKQQLLTNMGLNASEFERVYDHEFPRIPSMDERVRLPTSVQAPPQLQQRRMEIQALSQQQSLQYMEGQSEVWEPSQEQQQRQGKRGKEISPHQQRGVLTRDGRQAERPAPPWGAAKPRRKHARLAYAKPPQTATGTSTGRR